MAKLDIKSMNITELEDLLKELGEPKFRAKQVFGWLYKGAGSFDEMMKKVNVLRSAL